jgi:hypothetical protein
MPLPALFLVPLLSLSRCVTSSACSIPNKDYK